MNWTAVRAIAEKDLRTVLRNRGVRVPLIVAPVVLLIVLPLLLVLGGQALTANSPLPMDSMGDTIIGRSLTSQEAATSSVTTPGTGQWAAFVLEVFFAPLYLLVPLVVATVIAADSFAGERERGTLEALLHTPTTDQELLTAKFLAAWTPAVVVGTVGFVVYCAVANLAGWPTIGRIFFPNLTWVLLGFWVSPAVAALGLGVMVIVSSRVESLQAAHQIGSLLVLPIILLVVAQVSGAIRLGPELVAGAGLVIWLVAALMVRYGATSLRREHLALRL